MEKINIFCFGFGQVAKNFIMKVKKEGILFNLTTTSRQKTSKRQFENFEHQSFYFDENDFDQNLLNNLKKADYILISIPPINNEDVVIKKLKKNIKNLNPKWITYLSATSVYGNHDGKWVDENSKTIPTSVNGKNRLNAEKSWFELFEQYDLPIQIFRLSGIYSDQNNILKRLKFGQVKIVNKKNHFFSRIHVKDIANILFKSLNTFKEGEIFNISDDKPAPNEEVISHGIKLLGINKPETINVKDLQSEMLKNFYNDSKKINNKKMKKFFNYKLEYPSFIEGLDHINNNFI